MSRAQFGQVTVMQSGVQYRVPGDPGRGAGRSVLQLHLGVDSDNLGDHQPFQDKGVRERLMTSRYWRPREYSMGIQAAGTVDRGFLEDHGDTHPIYGPKHVAGYYTLKD